MACRGTNDVELAGAGRSVSRRLQCPGEQLIVVHGTPKSDMPAAPGDLDKINHDFRASLNIIIGFAELLLNEVPGKINDEQRCSLNDILNNGKRLLHLGDAIIEQYESGPVKKH
jgi:His Kinase A (phospho-acceptor) domain